MHCIDIGIREEWYGIASGVISFRNNSVCSSISASFPCSNFSTLWPIFSSPEPWGSQGELIVYPYSGVRCRRWRRCRRCRRRRRRPQCLNIFSSETALPITAKFYVEFPWEGGTKVYINGPGHMTKMAAMPIYGKNLKKSSSPEPEVLWSWNLACCIGDSSSTKFI